MKSLTTALFMTTMMSLNATNKDYVSDEQSVDFTQPIAITKTVKKNKTTFYAYLPDNHRVTICRYWPVTGKKYSGALFCVNTSNSVPVLGIDGLLTIERKKSTPAETFVASLGSIKSKELFLHYQHLFNNNV